MSSEIAIKVENLSKHYQIYNKPSDRLKQFFFQNKKLYKDFAALEKVTFTLPKGDILGVVGKNGSGKSTLLQMICGTVTPSSGTVNVSGRIAALLELGAGFNMEFTGHENIFLYASILGVSKPEIEALYDDIVAFSELGVFIFQPVKTYSSGMYVRLAFSIAVCVRPEILVIDEALSVGDGAFSRKSFNRIMDLKEQGKTILFCSHNMYQVESLCSKAIWLDHGEVKLYEAAADVVAEYNQFLDKKTEPHPSANCMESAHNSPTDKKAMQLSSDELQGTIKSTNIINIKSNRILNVRVEIDNLKEQKIATSRQSNFNVKIDFQSDINEDTPVIAICFLNDEAKCIASSGTHVDQLLITRDEKGLSSIEISYPQLPLLKGNYYIDIYLMGNDGIYIYEHNYKVYEFKVIQNDLEQGVVSMPHQWNNFK